MVVFPSPRCIIVDGTNHRSWGVWRRALIGGIRAWRKAGRWYRFGSGQVQSLSNAGTILWYEDVLGIQSGTISYDHKHGYMRLQWANAKRRIDIYPSFAEALKALEPPAAPAGVPID
jgi:hypothetical protein